jgi:hypothetical protein
LRRAKGRRSGRGEERDEGRIETRGGERRREERDEGRKETRGGVRRGEERDEEIPWRAAPWYYIYIYNL